ncbi:hypothetical protein SY88_10330 [Clostridiales bacterium PH28_bin88]|nr:hypothetical protein SY88_10330 [Clostridiales bacterium PH28_bin88]
MKRYLKLVLPIAVGMLLLASTALLASGKDINVMLDGHELSFDTGPQIVDGRVMVPLRGIFEALGADVLWDGKARRITATKGETHISLTVNNKTAFKDGASIQLETAPYIDVKGRTFVPLRFISESLGATVEWDQVTRRVFINSLPVVGSFENLKTLLAKTTSAGRAGDAVYKTMDLNQAERALASNEALPAAPAAASPDYSQTNIQVQGVDEADVVKTDGNYIYQVNNRRIVIVKASPAKEMKVESILTFNEGEFYPTELYVDDRYLVVIGSDYRRVPLPAPRIPGGVEPMIAPEIYPPFRSQNTVKVLVYDITDKSNINKTREAELEGSYVSSRKIGSSLYFVANKYADVYYIMKEENASGSLTPTYRDTAGTGELKAIGYESIHYFPEHVDPNYLMVAGLNLDEPEKEMTVSTYLGSGQNIYVSQHNLFVAVTQWENPVPLRGIAPDTPVSSKVMPITEPPKSSTTVYKFALENGRANYAGKGNVPGTILNQFSMDEHKGYFRIATTKGDMWRNDEYTSKNNIYVLDEKMKLTGQVEDLAPGERIYSVRFMGDRAYMVTFKQVDPLFVIDMKDPKAPKVLGKLKIPGYSDYLHPYDENHIIGFGKDTIELPQKDWQGRDTGTMAFYQGMKMAVFDVSDVENPVEKFKEVIGDRGTDSELLRNHKALLFSKEKDLLAFPVTVMEVKQNQQSGTSAIPAYGEFAFQGAYVYGLNMTDGFTLRGRITHLTGEDYKKAGYYGFDYEKSVNRILYIGNNLYTLSNKIIQAHDLTSLEKINAIAIQ